MENRSLHRLGGGKNEPSLPGGRSHPGPRGGFTLVELLVVIVIIGLIAGIAVPVVMQSLTKARNAAIKAEIDMLHMAIMNYKNEYGSFPPCYISGFTTNDDASRHILRLFPRTASIATETAGAAPIQPHNAIVSWLNGYKDDPTSPLKGAGVRKKLYDFDQSRLDDSQIVYFPSGKSGSPYIYFLSGTGVGRYGTTASPNVFTLTSGTYTVGGKARPTTSVNYSAQLRITTSSTTFFNPDTFQILCAGRDEEWNTDDDLSNFWPGTRREYVESQK